MASVSAQTRQTLTAISGLIQANRVSHASADLTKLIRELNPQVLVLVSHDIRSLIEGFQKQRRRDLLEELQRRLGNVASAPKVSEGINVRSQVSPASIEQPLSTRISSMLQGLAKNHIFKWSPHYRDALGFVVDAALNEFSDSGSSKAELAAISELFSAHSKEIFGRGYTFQITRGLMPTVAELKSVSGLQAFLDLVVSTFLERRHYVESANQASILWGLTSGILTGIAAGYGAADFGGVPGWQLLTKNARSWVPPMGFCRGVELMAFFEDIPPTHQDHDLFRTLGATALAIDRLAHKFYGDDVLLPRLSRMSVQLPVRLDITLFAKRGMRRQDLLVTCFLQGKLQSRQPITAAQALRAAVVVAALDERTATWVERDRVAAVVDAEGHAAEPQQIQHLSELIFARLEDQEMRDDAYSAPSVMTHNFAKDFPLDDPDFRRQFLVERHSVKLLLEQFDGSTGIHLWCSVRRSGKTTAAQELADSSGSSVVVTQTLGLR